MYEKEETIKRRKVLEEQSNINAKQESDIVLTVNTQNLDQQN